MRFRFWQVVYSLVHTFRNWKETLSGWQDRLLLAMKKPAAQVVVALILAVFLLAFFTQGAMAFTEHEDGSITFTAEEKAYIVNMNRTIVLRLQESEQENVRLRDALKAEQGKQCI